MLPSDVIELALQRANMSFAEVGDGNSTTGEARCYQFINMIKDNLWSAMVASTTAKDLSWEEWTQDFTAQQSEYALPQVVSDENRLKKVQKLYVAYTLDTYSKTGAMKYTSARHVDRKTLPEDWSYYTANQSESDPIYTISDKAIFVAPISESTIANGLKLTGVKKIPDYTSSTTEEGMVIPDDYHYVLVDGLEEQLLRKQGARASAGEARANYVNNKRELLATQRDTHIGPFQMRYPDETINDLSSTSINIYR